MEIAKHNILFSYLWVNQFNGNGIVSFLLVLPKDDFPCLLKKKLKKLITQNPKKQKHNSHNFQANFDKK